MEFNFHSQNLVREIYNKDKERQLNGYEKSKKMSVLLKNKHFNSYFLTKEQLNNVKKNKKLGRKISLDEDELEEMKRMNDIRSNLTISKYNSYESNSERILNTTSNFFLTNQNNNESKDEFANILRMKKNELDSKILSYYRIYEDDKYSCKYNDLNFIFFSRAIKKPNNIKGSNVKLQKSEYEHKIYKKSVINQTRLISQEFKNKNEKLSNKQREENDDFLQKISKTKEKYNKDHVSKSYLKDKEIMEKMLSMYKNYNLKSESIDLIDNKDVNKFVTVRKLRGILNSNDIFEKSAEEKLLKTSSSFKKTFYDLRNKSVKNKKIKKSTVISDADSVKLTSCLSNNNFKIVDLCLKNKPLDKEKLNYQKPLVIEYNQRNNEIIDNSIKADDKNLIWKINKKSKSKSKSKSKNNQKSLDSNSINTKCVSLVEKNIKREIMFEEKIKRKNKNFNEKDEKIKDKIIETFLNMDFKLPLDKQKFLLKHKGN